MSAVDGNEILALPQKVIKEPQADGYRKSVRVNQEGSLNRQEIATWPRRSIGWDLGPL